MFFQQFDNYDSPLIEGVILSKAEIPKEYQEKFGISESTSSLEFLSLLCEEGMCNLGINNLKNYADYKKRLEYELSVLDTCGFIDYIILNWEIVSFCKKENIPVGDGRGSAASSLVLFLIGVTRLDPLKYDLIFERFVSLTRAKKIIGKDGREYLDGGLLADVDLDISYSERQRVVDFISEKFSGNTCRILTINTLSGKLCMKECMKIVGGFTEDESKRIADLIPKRYGVVRPLREAYELGGEFQDFCDKNPLVYKTALKLENLNANTGVHPSGIAISAFPLKEIMPVQKTKDGALVSGFEMGAVAEMMIKFDILGLRTLTLIKKVCDKVGIDYTKIDYENPFIYDQIKKGILPIGLFQIEAKTNYDCATKVLPKDLHELADVVALARPGALAFVDDYISVKNGKSIPESGSVKLDKLLAKTKGIALFQETIMSIAHQVFGFSLEDAEKLRKIVGKKETNKIAEWESKIKDNAKRLNIPDRTADYFWNVCLDSANYSFNKCLDVETTFVDRFKPSLMTVDRVLLAECEVGDMILSYDFARKTSIYVPIEEFSWGEEELFEFEMEYNSSISCSMKHKFTCVDKQKHTMEEILEKNLEIFSVQPTRVKSYKALGVKKCVDICVGHEGHVFYANGLLTSNSHSYCYAATAAKTVYLKYKYPKEFFCSLLELAQDEPDPYAEIEKISQELPSFGIKLLPPDLMKSGLNFKIEGSSIRYGINSIKGVSEKTLEKVIGFRKEGRNDICDVYETAKRSGLSIGVMASFAQAGLFDSLLNGKGRCWMVYALQLINTMTQRQKEAIFSIYKLEASEKDNVDILHVMARCLKEKSLSSDGKPIFGKTTFEDFQKKTHKYKAVYDQNSSKNSFANWFFERKILGYAFSKTLREVFVEENTRGQTEHEWRMFSNGLMRTNDFSYLEQNESVKIIGWVGDDFKKGISKNKNRYWRFSLNDEFGSVICLFNDNKFSHPLLNYQEKIEKGKSGAAEPEKGDVVIAIGKKYNDAISLTDLYFPKDKIYSRFSELDDEFKQ